MDTSSALSIVEAPGLQAGRFEDEAAGRSASNTRARARKRKRRATPELLAAFGVVAGIGAVGLGAASFVVEEPAAPQQVAAISPAAQSALSLLAKPSTERVPLRGSAGTAVLAVGSGGRAAIVLRGFAPAPAGSVYHAWVRTQRGPFDRAATFAGTERVVLLSRRVEPGGVVGVTREASEAGAPSVPPRIVAVRP